MSILKIVHTEKFDNKLGRLPKQIQRKFLKQIQLLQSDFRHPSLHAKRMEDGYWEARIDLHYRFKFSLDGGEVVLLVAGMHDEGLGKK